MKTKTHFKLIPLLLLLFACSGNTKKKYQAEVWLTKADGTVLFEKSTDHLIAHSADTSLEIIHLEPEKLYQEIDGFGYTLTGGSAFLLSKMEPDSRTAILNELFSITGNNIGISYLRISIGASDLDEQVFSYCDLPKGAIDPELVSFSLSYDTLYLIPVLKEILKINPEIKLMGSPWSAPIWMKTNGSAIGGSLKPEFYESYARYFVKYIRAMKAEGISIDAVTVQNEPLHPGNNPSMFMLAEEQAEFIKNHLGPAFVENSIDTKIIIYDHNADRTDYPISILNDSAARRYIDGSAFHLYGGGIEALSEVHERHPDKNLYFTEQWIGAPANFAGDLSWHTENLIIGATRNWCRTVLEWNLAADPNQQPHTDHGGCTRCLGAITIDGNVVERNPAYYIIAHASKFVRPGSARIESNQLEELPNSAFLNPDGELIVIVMNKTEAAREFVIRIEMKDYPLKLESGSVATVVFRKDN